MVLRISNRTRASDRAPAPPPRQRRDRALEQAIAEDRIHIHFQPQIEPRSGRAVGVEALARWDQAASPEQLFVRAERAGLAERLSRHIQAKALRMASRWTGPLAGLRLSINLLPDDLAREGFDAWLLREITESRFPAGRLTVEITENALLEDKPAVSARLTRLREAGVAIAVDDFGTGYASLGYLTSLPLDILKIDKGLVDGWVGGERDRIVASATIRLARELGLTVIVEGVETAGQLALLTEWGCDLYQGFLEAEALSEDELARFVTANRALAA